MVLYEWQQVCYTAADKTLPALHDGKDRHGLKHVTIGLLNSHTMWCRADVGKQRNCSALDWTHISTSLCNLSAYENEIDRYHCLL